MLLFRELEAASHLYSINHASFVPRRSGGDKKQDRGWPLYTWPQHGTYQKECLEGSGKKEGAKFKVFSLYYFSRPEGPLLLEIFLVSYNGKEGGKDVEASERGSHTTKEEQGGSLRGPRHLSTSPFQCFPPPAAIQVFLFLGESHGSWYL